MAKKGKSNNLLGTILIIVGIVLAIGAFLCSFAAGLSYHGEITEAGQTINGNASIPLIGLMFGGWTMTVIGTTSGILHLEITLNFVANGGLSYCALISFILLVLGVILGIVSLFIKGKIFPALSGLLIFIAGILIFLTHIAGSDVALVLEGENTLPSTPFVDFIEDNELKLGVGTILYGVLGILGGIVTLGGTFLKKK